MWILLTLYLAAHLCLPLWVRSAYLATWLLYAGTLGLFAFLWVAGGMGGTLRQGRKYLCWLIAFFFLVLVTALAGGDAKDLRSYLPYTVLDYLALGLLLATTLRSTGDAKRTVKLAFWASFFSGVVIGLLQYFRGEMLFEAEYFDPKRLVTLNLYDPNYAMLPLLMCWIANLYLISVEKKTLSRVLYLTSAVGVFASVILTYSRAGWLCLAVGTLLFFALNPRVKIFSLKSMAACVLLLVTAYCAARFLGVFDHVASDSRMQSDDNVSNRALQWVAVFVVLKSNPIFGLGVNDYVSALGSVSQQFMTTHNLVLQVLVQRGAVGLLFFLSLVGLIVWNYWKCHRLSSRHDLAGCSALVAFGASSFVCYLLMCQTVSDSVGFYVWFHVAFSSLLRPLIADSAGRRDREEPDAGDPDAGQAAALPSLLALPQGEP